jgi:hypothetical protein
MTIGVVTNLFFIVSKAMAQSLSKMKALSLTNRVIKGLAILEKSLMNLH